MLASAHLHCATCGTDNPIQAAFCFACGQSFRAASGSLAGSASAAALAPHHLLKERYRTEQAYQELKTELGLDHYEGRRYSGWHHHVSVVLCCYAFVIAERERHFPPCACGAPLGSLAA